MGIPYQNIESFLIILTASYHLIVWMCNRLFRWSLAMDPGVVCSIFLYK